MASGERTRYYQHRPRRIPPEFATDELLEDCSVFAALLLYRLISLADDQGRLAGHPKSVRATAFPMRPTVTERKIGSALNELVHAGFVIRYEAGGRWFLQIDRWWDLQGKWGQRRTYPSRYPAPPGWTHDWVTAGQDEEEVPASGAHGAGDVPPPLPSSSSSSFTGSLPGLVEARHARGGPERVGHLLGLAKGGHLTKDEAMELGGIVAADVQSRERSAR